MQAIINDLLYDTDTSELIYYDENRDRRYYKSPNNAFFILFKTGEIVVTSEENIKEILGKNDIDEYVKLFGEPKEG